MFNTIKEFDLKTISYFFNRLKLFLLVESDIPKVKIVFTGNKTTRIKYFGNEQGSTCLGFYSEKDNTIVLNAERLKTTTKEFHYAPHLEFINNPLLKKYNYCVHLPLLYHELLHSFQYHLGSYTYNSLLEGTADIFSFILTGEECIDYIEETTALWYIGRKILKYNLTNFYNFIVSIINNEDDTLQQRFSNNKQILKTVVKNYNGDWAQFFKNLHKEYGNTDNLENMKKELCELHNLIFYKY